MGDPSSLEFSGQSSANASLTSSSSNSVQPLEGEIVDSESNPIEELGAYPVSIQSNSEDGEVVSLVKQQLPMNPDGLVWVAQEPIPSSNFSEIAPNSTPPNLTNYLLDRLFTPWGISSLLLLLVANILLTFNQGGNSSYLTAAENASAQPQELAISPSLNLAVEKPDRLDVKSLSTLPFSPSVAVKLPLAAGAPAPQAKNVPSASNLSTALLPPSLRPELPQGYPLPASLLPVPAPAPVSSYPQPAPQTTVQAIPVPPSLQPVSTNPAPPIPVPSPPPPSNTATPEPALAIPHALEQNRQELENASPLGFNQKTRLKMQAAQNQSDPNQLTEQMEQIQIQAVPESPK
jgi:hypothetical protein